MASLLTQAYTDIDDLMTKWFTFAVTNGWTQDQLDTGADQGAISKGTIFASYDWSNSTRLEHYLALAYTGGAPGSHTDDSGPQGGSRETLMGFGAGTADFFAGTEGGSEYLVCVAQDQPELYRMWYVGELIKVGDWTGGEIQGNQSWPIFNSFSPDQDNPFDSRNKTLFDGLMGENTKGCVVHVEGVHGFAGKWGMLGNASSGNDASGTARATIAGPGREGMWFSSLNWLQAQPNTGFVPLQPYPLHYRSGASWTLLGFVPGMRGLNITFISPREEFTLGGDTWKAYPWVKKSSAGSGTPESQNQGLAFLK